MDKIKIRGVNFDNVNMAEALEKCETFINADNGAHTIHTPNAEIVEMCVESTEKRNLINSADLIIPDGSGVILAGKILGTPLPKGKVAGIELAENLVRLSGEKGFKIFLLGSKPANDEMPSVAERAKTNLLKKYPNANIVGTRDGYFKGKDDEVIEEINNSGADILFVCLGVPKQEEWMNEHKNQLKVKLMGGFGGSLDVFAGAVERAPDFYIKHNLEWLFRLKKEPSRIGRMMKLPKFIFGSVKDKIIRKKY